MKSKLIPILSLFLVLSVGVMVSARPAHAIDKRLKLMFKTAGYGAAAGAVVGGATWALGLGEINNVLLGASVGLYAGILLAAYIVFVPSSKKEDTSDPYGPRRRLDRRDQLSDPPDGWIKEDEDEEEEDGASLRGATSFKMLAIHPLNKARRYQKQNPALWTPVFQMRF